jgi:hypothetical protein
MRSMTDEVLELAIRGLILQFLSATIRPSSGCFATTFSRMGEGVFSFVYFTDRAPPGAQRVRAGRRAVQEISFSLKEKVSCVA